MTAISKSFASATTAGHLRPFNPRRDLEAVADLVDLCFGDTMDPDGKSYVEHMRATARNPSLLNWASSMAEWASAPFGGYVWQQDDRVVGNASLIPYYVRGRRFFLIANVAVHPDYRRRGIARRLTERAVEHARQKGSSSVWLHVREENEDAVRLYRSLGFLERARRTAWHSGADSPQVELPAGVRISRPRSPQWDLQRLWLKQSYPPELSWHMPIKIGALRPGFLGTFPRFLYNLVIEQWAILQKDRLLAAVSWQPTAGYTNALWLAAPSDGNEHLIQALLTHARQRAPSHRPLMLDYPAWQHIQAIQGAGFEKRQTLIWMELVFSQ